jgi:hypothetical protein
VAPRLTDERRELWINQIHWVAGDQFLNALGR